MAVRAVLRLVVDVAEVVAAWLHLVVWTTAAMGLVLLAGVAGAVVGGPALGGLLVGALSVCVVVTLLTLLAALHIRTPWRTSPLMPTTHPRAVRRAAAAVFAALLLLALLVGCRGPGGPRPAGVSAEVVITGAVMVK
ncbi:hypothetical protein [Saccharothrix australiensis]|uniref:Uncharacterized protein n=1 Tax=Saccharothrix australiensis TaxID=2072 RepID=A0A495VNA4_9PSEU|nr:hypothetical protein [Saccharothrix australiensis]RKT49288.1 hypothetical protein C8E97_6784 [Saccharothrix australiensis]